MKSKAMYYGMLTICLIVVMFCMLGLCAQSKTVKNRSRQEQEQIYLAMEQEYVADVRQYLENSGLRNAGIMLTNVREITGFRTYTLKIHHKYLEELDFEEQQELKEALEAMAFQDELSSFRYVLESL